MRISYALITFVTSGSLASAAPGKDQTHQHAEHRRQLGTSAGNIGKDATFDYVIVGGGTAGLVMANRLSSQSGVTVAVIEAGTFYQVTNPILGNTPAGDVIFAGSSPLDSNPLVDWNFVTQGQAGANNRRVHYARGKCLGGSSARNFMIYQRGTVQTYQKWADAVGDDSYTWDALLPYFKKSVKFTTPKSSRSPNASAKYNSGAFSAAGGPLDVSYANYAQPFSAYLEPSLNEIGISQTQDFNSGQVMGAQYCSSTIQPNSQKRESSQTSFLDEAIGRSNLKVYQLCLAKRILFDNNKRATGVVVTSNLGLGTFTLQARKEVILSAGAFQSPQLLMVSGIGPRDQLEKFNIPVVAERPGVGKTMEDHVFFGPTWRVKVQTLTRLANDLVYTAAQFAGPYTLLKQGPLTNPIADFLGWEKTPRDLISAEAAAVLDNEFPPDWPEIEYLSAPGYVGDFSNLLTTQPKDGYQYATILGALVAPLSRGTVTLASADTQDLPLINPNWLTDPTDVAVAIATFKRMRQAFASNSMRPVLADNKEYFPGPGIETDEQILQNIRNTVMTVWHASCTCRMGKKDNPMAVVDKDAKVIGVDGLRVVDASSFALLPPGHPQSTVYVLAEKISAEILASV
ncbi:GMC oxidoreductase [Colletotrichum graminicola]|uniref:GMC oxidoreductase n=1 Tax=Colletotrichum graminicola (strain M1.001 / M2 / FGSC 10212) TaxID=645133 RepID=E3Q9F2_COLGM|nr:GMC oxidoreductase [Colletotrichum graminicola M1.001]EFQ27331.1 GMC oxidoreductase [Colletotrichum graminicola M1.001]WDK13117.1 GMC oxidoreductase [Colletotrichum graminicola]